MGATTDCRVFDTDDRAKIKKAFAAACEQARYSDGNEYPGSIACFHSIREWEDRRFQSQAEASDYLFDRHDKWEPAMAVSFRLPAKPTKAEEQKRERTRDSLRSWQERLGKARRKVIEAFQKRTSGTVGCPKCKSRLNRAFLKRPECPVCGETMISKTDRERIEKIEARIQKAKAAHAEAMKPRTNGKIGWVVGGWCPE